MDATLLRVTVAFCAPGVEDVSDVTLPPGSTVRDAIAAAGLRDAQAGIERPGRRRNLGASVFNRPAAD